jgi:L-rhamnose mutarotase
MKTPTRRRFNVLCALGLALILAGCACLHGKCRTGDGHSVQRYGMITGLKPDKVDEYKDLHANPWPGVLKTIRECNIRNYSIYLVELDGDLYLFSYFEYIGDDFDADMAKMARDPVTQEWWSRTDPCQIPLPGLEQGKIWKRIEEVFHCD